MAASPTTGAIRAVGQDRPAARSRTARWLPWALAAALFSAYALVSVRLQQRMLTTGFDLGYFEQTVRSWAGGHWPVIEMISPGHPELGDHFSPILATLAPFYRLWPSPYTLLLGQAALLAVAVVPLSRWAVRALGTAAAWVIGMAYGLSWGIASAVGFDFHEVAFAVPLLAFSLCALGQGRLRAAALWALPLLLVKEDLGITVAVIGLLIAWRGRRLWGLATAATGIASTLLEVLVVLPALNPSGRYGFTGDVRRPGGGVAGLLYHGTVGLVSAPEPKPLTLILVLAPTAFFALRSPLVLAAAPTLLWRFASDNPLFWGTMYHYSAVLMPIVFAALVDGLVRRPVDRRTLRQVLATSLAVTVLLLPQFALFELFQPVTWQTPPRVAAAHAVLRLIPDGATVAATNQLVPQLTHRATVSLFGLPQTSPGPRWIIVDTGNPGQWPFTGDKQAKAIAQAAAGGYRTVIDRAGYLLLQRPETDR